MIAVLAIFLVVSVAVNVMLAYAGSDNRAKNKALKSKEKERKALASKNKGLLGSEHVLWNIHKGFADTENGGLAWGFDCSCGVSLAQTGSNNERKAVEHWKSHVELYTGPSKEKLENESLKKELDKLKDECICRDL